MPSLPNTASAFRPGRGAPPNRTVRSSLGARLNARLQRMVRKAQRAANGLPPVRAMRNVRTRRMNGTLYPGRVSLCLGPVVIHDASALAADIADRAALLLWRLGRRVVTTAVTTAVQLGREAVQDVLHASAVNPHPNGWELFPIEEAPEHEEQA